jgi:hypothetical protein
MAGGRTRQAATALAVGLLVLAAGCAGRDAEPRGEFAGAERTVTSGAGEAGGTASGLDAARGFRSVRGYRATAVPVRLEIARIGVATVLEPLGKAADGTVEVPSDGDVAGWYAPGPRPGDPGSAVLVGHVDSKSGPAVFYRLRELRRGDRVEVVRADRSRVAFTVDRVEQYDKRAFPTDEVYYPTLRPALRLVTCGGAFDQASGHYRDNVIAFAELSR